MAKDLTTLLKEKSRGSRKGQPAYFEDGDFVTFFCADDLSHEERADELVTIYRSFKTGDMVGCKIKGVQKILSTFGNFGVVIHDHGSKLTHGMLFMGAALLAEPDRRAEYENLGKRFGKMEINVPFEQAA